MTDKNNVDTKVRLVQDGKSAVFENWHEWSGGSISAEDFTAGLEWLCEDPLDGRGRLTRELGCEVTKDAVIRAFMEDPDVPDARKAAYGGAWDQGKVGGRLVRLRRVYTDPEQLCEFYTEDGRLWRRGRGTASISARDRV